MLGIAKRLDSRVSGSGEIHGGECILTGKRFLEMDNRSCEVKQEASVPDIQNCLST